MQGLFAVADVIFPTFFWPYAVLVFYPAGAVVLLLSEFALFRWLYATISWKTAASLIAGANAVSTIVGTFVSVLLPSSGKDLLTSRAEFAIWTLAPWVLAWVVSVGVEYAFYRYYKRVVPAEKLGRNVVAMNLASYAGLLGTFFVLNSPAA